jgi:hypothetical protein
VKWLIPLKPVGCIQLQFYGHESHTPFSPLAYLSSCLQWSQVTSHSYPKRFTSSERANVSIHAQVSTKQKVKAFSGR